MKALWHILRLMLGVVFIFSGFVKGIDPWGAAYKFTDYFNAWGMEILTPLAFSLGVLLSAAEFVMGLSLVANVFVKFVSWVVLLFMVFFTGVTLFVAVGNPVSDCGCFGDALVLTNWETFWKNIVFLIFAFLVFAFRKKMGTNRHSLFSLSLGVGGLAVYIFLVVYSYNHLPVIDFRPYKVGTNIAEGMLVPEDAPRDVYENIFYYRNRETGDEQQFTQENYPWQDTLHWEFVSMDSKLVQKGYEPPIHNFTMETPDGEDVRDFFLYDENYTFMLVAYDLSKANHASDDRIRVLAQYALDEGMNFVGLSAATFDEAEQFLAEAGWPFEFFMCDEITLKTIVRSNPGLVLLKNGNIIGKWHYNDIPSVDGFIRQKEKWEEQNEQSVPTGKVDQVD